MSFIPEKPKSISADDVPYFDDVTEKGGWQGQRTGKSLAALKSEITQSIGRLGGTVTNFQRGAYETEGHKRAGFQVRYVIETPEGNLIPGRIDIAALPVRDTRQNHLTVGKRSEQSLCMALYMLKMALDGTWFLQQLSPGYAALMPFMLVDGERTISQVWGESAMRNLLPPPESQFIEGVVSVVS